MAFDSTLEEGKHYTSEFYGEQEKGSLRSAEEVLSFVNDIFHPVSVIDVGCGVGYWLKTWRDKFDVQDYFGIEGPYLSEDLLKIPKDKVRFHDLKMPIELDRKFDLSMSLEVAEHLPASSADTFVASLVSLSNIVLFSAAIPGQEGTHHINEQMPEYWAEKFLQHDYVAIDYIRPRIWTNKHVEWWYRQNILLFVDRRRLPEFPILKTTYEQTSSQDLFRVQPWLYFYKLDRINKTSSFAKLARWKLYKAKKYIQKHFLQTNAKRRNS